MTGSWRPRAGGLARRPFTRLLAAGWAVRAGGVEPAWAAQQRVVRAYVSTAATSPISPFVFGTNDIGTMNSGAASADLERGVGVTLRRLGGNSVSTYNWTNGCNNIGKDWYHHNSRAVTSWYVKDDIEKNAPLAAIRAVHERSLADGARSVIQLPVGPWVAADADGVVPPEQAAPSPRWVPVSWNDSGRLDSTIDTATCNVPQLIRRLIENYGPAAGGRGVLAYALDNEPAIWHQTHPRAHPTRMPIGEFLDRSVEAARRIKSIDPTAWVVGPGFWGATAMQTFQNAPDWRQYADLYPNMVAVYLDRFREASNAAEQRLLDAFDIHWYPYSDDGRILNTEDNRMADVVLAAPRELTDASFRPRSWVASAFPPAPPGQLDFPILPQLQSIVDRWYSGTALTISEFNYGHLPESALALADALGRFATSGVVAAAHWGRLVPPLDEAYRLWRNADGNGLSFPEELLAAETEDPARVSIYAGQTAGQQHLQVVTINRADETLLLDLDGPFRERAAVRAFGFDARQPTLGELSVSDTTRGLALSPRSAAHWILS